MKRPLQHVKWADKKMPESELQKAFDEAIKKKAERSNLNSGKTHKEALKENGNRSCHSYTPNNYAEMEYNGTLNDDWRR